MQDENAGTEEKQINIEEPVTNNEQTTAEEIPVLNNTIIDEMASAAGKSEELEKLRSEFAAMQEKLNAAQNTVEDTNNKYIRLRAEFDNYKRRTDAEREKDFKYSAKNFILKMLPVVDDLDRSLAFYNSGTDAVKLADGIKLIHEKLHKILADEGVSKFESLHKPFDVELHSALMRQENAEHPSDTVVQEFSPGYMYKDLVLRHAQVAVSENPEAVSGEQTAKEADNPSAEETKE